MAKFRVTVTRTDEYEIELNDSIITSKYIKDWASVFYPAHDQEDFAKHIAAAVMQHGSSEGYYEGFGHLTKFAGTTENKQIEDRSDDNPRHYLPKEKYSDGIKVFIIDEDDVYDYDVEKIN